MMEELTLEQRNQPTIGIITALPQEHVAVKAVVDNLEEFSLPGRGAGRRYFLGEVPAANCRKHIITLLLADVGNNIAATRATLLLERFPNVNTIIMVGIAGGIPFPDKPDEHVRLGDIVVSNQNGVIQYDFDKETITETIHRHSPRPPSAQLLEGVRLLEAAELEGKYPWIKFIEQAIDSLGDSLGWGRPDETTDILANSVNQDLTVEHPLDRKRQKGQPRIFVGPIASANKLLKNPIKRDELRDKFSVKAIEMEGSGIADATWNHEIGYLVVRGICDYCDTNKGDLWQEYAAIVAAAYVRSLLETIPTELPMGSPATLQAGFTNWIDISDQIVNPGFEDRFLGWEEDSSVINSEQAASRSVDDSTEAHGGTRSRKLFLREGGSYIKQIVKLKNPLSAQCQIRLGVHVKMPFRGVPANKWFTLMLITHGGSSDQVDYAQTEQVDTLVEWTKVTAQTEQLDYPIHKLEIHAFTTKGGGAHKGFDKPVWVDDFTIEYRSLES